MKKHTLKMFLKIELIILKIRIYFIIQDMNFVLYQEDHDILRKKYDWLLTKTYQIIAQIELL